jgi:transposase
MNQHNPPPQRSVQPPLFDLPDSGDVPAVEPGPALHGRPRLQCAERRQVEFQPFTLDELIPADHEARNVWEYVKQLDLSGLYDAILAVEGHVGRSPIDPKILMALWLYATIEGVGSARELNGLCTSHVAYRWICGGVSVNYHTLSDFRTAHVELLDDLLTDSVGILMHQGLVTLNRVAEDGMRVRASAGASSFRRQETLEKHLAEAHQQVTRLKEELEQDPGSLSRRQKAARERAARERAERVARALAEREEVEARREARKKGSGDEARASTTDPDARRMKMADGGTRPGYNVQFATDSDSFVTVGVIVTNSGSDAGGMSPMVEQLVARYWKAPDELLADGGFSTVDDIEAVESKYPTTVYTPIKEEDKKVAKGIDPFAPRPRDSEIIGRWRQRMGTPVAKEIYKDRSSGAELPNAHARNRGLRQFLVRGELKVLAVTLWQVLAHNFKRAVALRKDLELSAEGIT